MDALSGLAPERNRLKAALEVARAAPPQRKSRPLSTPTVDESIPPPLASPPVGWPSYRMANFTARQSAEPHEISVAQMADIVQRAISLLTSAASVAWPRRSWSGISLLRS